MNYDHNELMIGFSSETVYKITKRCFKSIGYNGTCHDFRRHFTQNLDKNGERMSVIKSLMGHSSVSTTSIYIRQNDVELKKIIDNQHRKKEAIDIKRYISNMDRLNKQVKTINDQKDFIKKLLKEV